VPQQTPVAALPLLLTDLLPLTSDDRAKAHAKRCKGSFKDFLRTEWNLRGISNRDSFSTSCNQLCAGFRGIYPRIGIHTQKSYAVGESSVPPLYKQHVLFCRFKLQRTAKVERI